MIKKACLILLSPFITMGYTCWYKPSVVDCARASHVVYHKDTDLNVQLNPHNLENYELLDDITNDECGMRVLVLKLKGTNNVVIAYRGTVKNNKANLLIDLGIAADALSNGDVSDYIYEHAKKWFAKYSSALFKTLSGTGSTFANYAQYIVSYEKALAALKKIGIDPYIVKKHKKNGIIHAFKVFQQIKKDHPGYNYYITGHSLGGFYAQLVGYHYGHTTFTFNAPGAYKTYRKLHPKWARVLWWTRSKRSIINYVREHDLVGTFGRHLGVTVTIPNITDPDAPEDDPSFTDKFWLLYQLPEYIKKNHTIRYMIDDIADIVST